MRCTMSWTDAAKAAAHAVLAERTTPPARTTADASFRWNAYEVWLSRVKAPLDLTPQCSPSEPTTPPRPGTAPRK